MGKIAVWKHATDYADDELVDQLPVCSWHVVTCAYGKWQNEKGVTILDFPHNQLLGHVHKALWYLPHVTKANFQGNTIEGAGFEGFGEENSTDPIHNILLSDNRLTRVAGISSTPVSLREISLSFNDFEGKSPHELTNINKLEVLYV